MKHFHLAKAGFLALTLLAACGGGPSKGEFVAACMKSQGFLGLTEDMCACAADIARSKFSSGMYTAMVYDMQGRKQDAIAIMEKVPEQERVDAQEATGEIFSQCFIEMERGSR